MNQNLEAIKNQYLDKIANLKTDKDLEALRIELFGRNGLINDLFSKIKEIPNEDKKQYPIILDEVQKIPLILDVVHWMIENLPGVQFILCGSSARKLKLVGANLLGGRAWRYMFLPLCYPELKTLNWQKIFNNGLLPSHYNSAYPEKLLASYLYDYLIAEVQLEANLRKQDSFVRFLEVLGFCHGEMVSFTNVARDCGVNGKTVKSYFDILVDMYLGYFLYPFRKKASRQIIQETPKF